MVRLKTGNDKLYIGVIIVLAVVIVYLVSQNSIPKAGQPAAVENVKNLYSLLSESSANVAAYSETNGIYSVDLQTTLRNGQQVNQTVFVTKDGSLMTDRMVNYTGYYDLLTREKAFAECLVGKNVRVAGVQNDANTLAQLQILGYFSYKVYYDCSGANLQTCQNAGITQVPTIIVGNQTATGVQPASFFENATGCKL